MWAISCRNSKNRFRRICSDVVLLQHTEQLQCVGNRKQVNYTTSVCSFNMHILQLCWLLKVFPEPVLGSGDENRLQTCIIVHTDCVLMPVPTDRGCERLKPQQSFLVTLCVMFQQHDSVSAYVTETRRSQSVNCYSCFHTAALHNSCNSGRTYMMYGICNVPGELSLYSEAVFSSRVCRLFMFHINY